MKELHSDMTVMIKGESIPCHKSIVGRYCKVIREAIAETDEFKIEEEWATVEGVSIFVVCMYNKWDNASMDPHVQEIYRLSHAYDSILVRAKAVNAFKRLMDVANFGQIVNANDGQICPLLLAVCVDFVRSADKERLFYHLDEKVYMTAATAKVLEAVLGKEKR